MQSILKSEKNKSLYLNRAVCPGCFTSTEKAKLEIYSKPQAESILPEEHGQFLSGYTNHRFFFSYYRCSDCSLLYCPTYYNEEELATLYKNQPENMSNVPFYCRIKTQENYFKKLKKYSPLDGGYLEIGADIGIFTNFCIEDGNFNYFNLFEPNIETHIQLKKITENHPVKIFTNDFSSSFVLPKKISTLLKKKQNKTAKLDKNTIADEKIASEIIFAKASENKLSG